MCLFLRERSCRCVVLIFFYHGLFGYLGFILGDAGGSEAVMLQFETVTVVIVVIDTITCLSFSHLNRLQVSCKNLAVAFPRMNISGYVGNTANNV